MCFMLIQMEASPWIHAIWAVFCGNTNACTILNSCNLNISCESSSIIENPVNIIFDFHVKIFLWFSCEMVFTLIFSCEFPLHVKFMSLWCLHEKYHLKRVDCELLHLWRYCPWSLCRNANIPLKKKKNWIVGLGKGMFDCILTDIQTSCYYSTSCWLSANDFFCLSTT